jgi:hypothetical protein
MGMKRIRTSGARAMIRWIFRRGNQLLTCRLARHVNGRDYILALVPHWDRHHGGAETFGSGLTALHRHAAVVTMLREYGWRVVAYSGGAPRPPRYDARDRRAA